jgi:predicted TPR repeat methyltransferase
MSEKPGFLNSAYGLETLDETRALYDDWAKTYDAEIAENGYATPKRCAEALASVVSDQDAAVLDVGCGTGLSGIALKAAGFDLIDGSDLSQEMLDRAAKHKNLYRALWLADASAPFNFAQGTYRHIAAMGVVAAGHAPPSTIDAIIKVLPKGGCFVFSLNDHTLQDPAFEARINENLDTGNAVLLFREYGPHLPGLNMKSNVYVMQKT